MILYANSGRVFTICRERGIRTPVGFASKHAFQACTLSHSDTSLSLISAKFKANEIIINLQRETRRIEIIKKPQLKLGQKQNNKKLFS